MNLHSARNNQWDGISKIRTREGGIRSVEATVCKPGDTGDGENHFVIILHDVTERNLRTAEIPPALADLPYRDKHGFINQCCKCRRVQNMAQGGAWERVPAWSRHMPLNTSHTVCSDCTHSSCPAPVA